MCSETLNYIIQFLPEKQHLCAKLESNIHLLDEICFKLKYAVLDYLNSIDKNKEKTKLF